MSSASSRAGPLALPACPPEGGYPARLARHGVRRTRHPWLGAADRRRPCRRPVGKPRSHRRAGKPAPWATPARPAAVAPPHRPMACARAGIGTGAGSPPGGCEERAEQDAERSDDPSERSAGMHAVSVPPGGGSGFGPGCSTVRMSVRQHDVAEDGIRPVVAEELFVALPGNQGGGGQTHHDVLDRQRPPGQRRR